MIRYLAALLAALIVCAPAVAQSAHDLLVGETRDINPRYLLQDPNGRSITNEDFSGRFQLIAFGYTYCPDVCPTTLATLSQALRQLQDLPAGLRPRVLLVSVDPERDPPEILAPYVRFFDPQFMGATGSLEATAAAAAAFSVPYAKVSLPEGGYTLDHGSGLFVVGPSGMLTAYFSAPHEAATIARDYRVIVEHLETER